MDVASPVAVVTGGGRGIGRGIALALAELGHIVVVNYRSDAESAEETCREAHRRGSPDARAIRADVSDPEEGRRLLDDAMALAGRIDLWVNNAGIAPERRLDLLETTVDSWEHVLGTNLRGPFFLTQAAARAMIGLRESGIVAAPQIVFITSISSRFASLTRGEYCVAKAGLSMVAQLFAARLAGEGIRVYEVRPGLIDTDMTRAVRAPTTSGSPAGSSRWDDGGPRKTSGRAVAAIASGALPIPPVP